MLRALKAAIVPASPTAATVRFGIARGVRMNIDWQHQTRQYLGLYELELDRYLRRVLKPGVLTFDVGAQHGYDALAAAKRTGARVAAFEMDPAFIELMTESFALNPELAPLVTPVLGMVGAEPDQIGLDRWAYESVDGFVPDFIKLDIEGGEADALRSGARILQARHPALVVEVHSRDLEEECIALLRASGYRPRVVSQFPIIGDHRPIPHNRWLVAPT